MPRGEPRGARKRAEKARAARPEPRFGVTDYVPGPSRSSRAPAGSAGSAGSAGGSAAAPTTVADRDEHGGRPRRRWRLPLAMLLVGLLLGAGGVGALVRTGVLDTSITVPAPEPSPSRVTVTVPESCTEAGRLAEQVGGITQEIVAATGELDAARLQVLVDQLQQLDPQVRAATAACEQDSPTLSATNG